MSHEVEAMMSIKETPWHGLGVVLPDYPDRSQILSLAGLDWNVIADTLQTSGGIEIPENKAIIRETDNTILGVVGNDYTIVQNSEMLEFFDPFLESGEVKITTAGSLQSGKKVWMLGEIQRPCVEISPSDEVAQFLLFSHSHNGSLAVRVGFTPIRVVCANTLAVAHSHGLSKLLRVKHTKGVKLGIEQIKESINLATQSFQATVEQYQYLATHSVSKDTLREYVTLLFAPKKEEEEDQSSEEEDISTRSKNIINKVLERVENSPGSELPGSEGTWWGAYNGVNYYLNYDIGRTQESRLDGIWFGIRKKQNEEALKLAVKMSS